MKIAWRIIIFAFIFGCSTEEKSFQNQLWFSSPAQRWFEALPIGNGRQGAMIYGGVKEELISLTENSYYSGAVSDHLKEGASEHLPAIRQALLSKNYQLATSLSENILASKSNYGTNLPMANLKITFEHESTTTTYKRSLNLENASATVAYQIDDVTYTREYLASNTDGIIAFHFKTNKIGALNFQVEIDGFERPVEISDSGQDLIFKCQAREQKHSDGQTGADAYSMVSVIDNDGSTVLKDSKLYIANASDVTILVATATTFGDSNPEKYCTEKIAIAGKKSFDQIRTDHEMDYRKLFHRMKFSLGVDSLQKIPTDERVKNVANGGTDLGLIPLMYQYARYLTISSSRENSILPSHLQGIWNDNVACQIGWTCDMHLDVNTQMNYWLTETTNLRECSAPLFHWIENTLVPSGKKTAKEVYGVNGWVAHTVSNPWGFTGPGWSTYWGLHPTAGAWIASHLWDRYTFTKDRQFLEKHGYPVLKSSAEFFMNYMFEDPATGYMVTGPACSPENKFRVGSKDYTLDMMPTGDLAIIRQLLESCVAAGTVLGEDTGFTKKVRATINKLPPYKIDTKGKLQEWYFDHEEALPHHRHMTHLLGVFPFASIQPEVTPRLAEAAWRSVLSRLTPKDKWEDTGWARSLLILNAARLWKADAANSHVGEMMRLLTEDNLMVIHPPTAGAKSNVYELDGNTGFCMGVTEMLLQSHFTAGDIKSNTLNCDPETPVLHLLPALPGQWDEGEICGLQARGGFEVDLKWKNNTLTEARVISKLNQTGVIRYGKSFETIKLNAGEPYYWKMP